jgi:hypothetical protein
MKKVHVTEIVFTSVMCGRFFVHSSYKCGGDGRELSDVCKIQKKINITVVIQGSMEDPKSLLSKAGCMSYALAEKSVSRTDTVTLCVCVCARACVWEGVKGLHSLLNFLNIQ